MLLRQIVDETLAQYAYLIGCQRTGDALIVDVRGASEYRAGHLPGSVNIPHTRLLTRFDELPLGRALTVHCASGSRAAVAAAALARSGFDVTYVDDTFTAVGD